MLTPHQVKSALQAGVLLIDLRPQEAFASRHIPGSIHIIFSRKSLSERIATAIPPGPSIIFLSEETDIAEAATEALRESCRNPLQGYMIGGGEAWNHAGFPLAQLPHVSVAELWQRLNAPHNDLTLIDVREPFECDLGHIDSALLVPLGEIWRRASTLDPHRDIVLTCEEGIRSSTAASILLHHGFPKVANIPGGMGSWLKAGYPAIRPPKPPNR